MYCQEVYSAQSKGAKMAGKSVAVVHLASAPTRWGRMALAEQDGKLVAASLPGADERVWHDRLVKMLGKDVTIVKEETPVLTKAIAWFDRYFSGKNPGAPPPVKLVGTKFQQDVWEALLAVPWGKTSNYGRIALATKHANAVRAVGQACGANPLAIMVPCHRIIRTDGDISNYAGGKKLKQELLALEGIKIEINEEES
jgi:methylated-DNA-[protein]-cysteine S-methyltransferase